jgi:hypothetical protein
LDRFTPILVSATALPPPRAPTADSRFLSMTLHLCLPATPISTAAAACGSGRTLMRCGVSRRLHPLQSAPASVCARFSLRPLQSAPASVCTRFSLYPLWSTLHPLQSAYFHLFLISYVSRATAGQERQHDLYLLHRPAEQLGERVHGLALGLLELWLGRLDRQGG